MKDQREWSRIQSSLTLIYRSRSLRNPHSAEIPIRCGPNYSPAWRVPLSTTLAPHCARHADRFTSPLFSALELLLCTQSVVLGLVDVYGVPLPSLSCVCRSACTDGPGSVMCYVVLKKKISDLFAFAGDTSSTLHRDCCVLPHVSTGRL